jgi:hypothetical protein
MVVRAVRHAGVLHFVIDSAEAWPQATAPCAARSVLDGGEHGATLEQTGSTAETPHA